MIYTVNMRSGVFYETDQERSTGELTTNVFDAAEDYSGLVKDYLDIMSSIDSERRKLTEKTSRPLRDSDVSRAEALCFLACLMRDVVMRDDLSAEINTIIGEMTSRMDEYVVLQTIGS